MTKTICDLCGADCAGVPVRVRVRVDEHPHSGAVIHSTVDCCARCVVKLPELSCEADFSELRRQMSAERKG